MTQLVLAGLARQRQHGAACGSGHLCVACRFLLSQLQSYAGVRCRQLHILVSSMCTPHSPLLTLAYTPDPATCRRLAATSLQARLYDGELEAVRCCAAEEASLHGSRLLAYLPGCILVNREPLGAGLLPDTSPNRITRAVLAAVYALLQVRRVWLVLLAACRQAWLRRCWWSA